ncbi:MAG: adenylate/guanylate cyclase domain-containing protein [Rhodospirillaceae bacterium]
MSRDTFEVYYHQNGRWQLHASYEASQREMAIEEAKSVEQKEGYATRVVRETFIPETNTTENVITFQSQKAKQINDADNMFGGGGKAPQKPAPKKQASAPRPAPRPAPAAASQPQKQQQKSTTAQAAPLKKAVQKGKKKKQRGAFMRTLIVIGSSSAIAVLSAAGMVAVLYALIQVGMLDPRANRAPLVGGTLVLTFFLALFVNLQKHFGILAMLKGSPSAPKRAARGPEAMMAMQAKTAKPSQDVEFDQVSIEDLREKVIEEIAEESAAEDAAMEEDDAPPALDADMDADMGADMGASVHDAASEAAPQPQPAAQQATPPPEPKRESPPQAKLATPAPAAPQISPAENEARATMNKFVADVMRHTPGDMNTFTRFGLNLYVAGAGSVVGQSKRLPRDNQLLVLKQGLQASGMPADRAEAFCVEIPSHGKNPKYGGMIQAGMKAMQEYLAGHNAVAAQIANLLQEWNLPEKRAAIPTSFTFVFTDIVGSTAMTQRLGNAGAQKAVRAHNTAVRGAIQAYKGREVKHTGDGIMAVFPDPPSAVAACIKIQREIAAHNAANPNIDVHLRIGINTGEAVEEENDFFGQAVQMTARICDKASKDNIWVSQSVIDGCKGQKFGFIPRGGFEMKGIQGAKKLFEVGWSDAHKNELADL